MPTTAETRQSLADALARMYRRAPMKVGQA